MGLHIKRVYLPPDPGDGVRILVDRLWPRGIARERAAIDEWMRDIAPSNALRKWYGHTPDRWEEFLRRYRAELAAEQGQILVNRLRALSRRKSVTLLYASKEERLNNAVALSLILKKKS